MQIDRQSIQAMRMELQAILAPFAAKHDVNVQLGNATYSPGQNVRFKLEIANKVQTGTGAAVVMTAEATAFQRLANTYGLQSTDLNRRFHFRNADYTIIGLKPKSYKFPILARRDDGQVFKFNADTILRSMGRVAVRPAGVPRDLVQIGADVNNSKDEMDGGDSGGHILGKIED